MNSQLMHWFLQFLLWFAVASTGGIASYWVLLLAPAQARETAAKAVIFVLALCCLAWPEVVLLLVIIGTVPSFAAAFCEKSLDESHSQWSSHFWLLVLTQLTSIPFAVVPLVFAYLIFQPSGFLSSDEVGSGFLSGLFLTPASISFFRWMLRNSQLHPGIDRHLNQGDEPK